MSADESFLRGKSPSRYLWAAGVWLMLGVQAWELKRATHEPRSWIDGR
jgi:hypothetical protein